MNYNNINLMIIKILRVFFGICFILGVVAPLFMDLDIKMILIFLLFCIILIALTTKSITILKG